MEYYLWRGNMDITEKEMRRLDESSRIIRLYSLITLRITQEKKPLTILSGLSLDFFMESIMYPHYRQTLIVIGLFLFRPCRCSCGNSGIHSVESGLKPFFFY
jgi:hypothetical protein